MPAVPRPMISRSSRAAASLRSKACMCCQSDKQVGGRCCNNQCGWRRRRATKSRAVTVIALPEIPTNLAVEGNADGKVPGTPSSCKGTVTVPDTTGEQVEPAGDSLAKEASTEETQCETEKQDDMQEPMKEPMNEHVESCQPPKQPPSTGSQAPPGAGAEDDLNVVGLGVTLDYIQGLARQAGTMGQRSRFHCVREPQLHLRAYLTRLRSYFLCSSECYVLTLVYIDRLIQRHPEIVVSPLSSHRLLITALTLAAKFFDDTFYSNAYYAWVGGLRVEELNSLEKTFLRLLDWRLHVQPEEFEFYQRMIKQSAVRCMRASNAPKPRAHLAGA